ncbi:glutathione S-transferase, partial [Rhizobium ruizarguesonis]
FGRISEREAYKRANALDDEAGKTMQAA